MIAFDTNYLVRHLVQDDPAQCRKVAHVLKAQRNAGTTVLLSDVMLCETVWVLETAYGAEKEDLLTALRSLLNDPVFDFETPARIRNALHSFEKGRAGFSDYLILETAREQGRRLKTFDRRLARELS